VIHLTEKSHLSISISDSSLRSGEFSVGSALDAELDLYAEISHCEPFCDTGLSFWQDKSSSKFVGHSCPVALDLVAVHASTVYVERAKQNEH